MNKNTLIINMSFITTIMENKKKKRLIIDFLDKYTENNTNLLSIFFIMHKK